MIKAIEVNIKKNKKPPIDILIKYVKVIIYSYCSKIYLYFHAKKRLLYSINYCYQKI